MYVGQADGVKSRIDSHGQQKDFWDTGIVFVSNSGGLNRAHVTWLEHALVARAQETKRCHLGNANAPQEPALSEAEKADTQAFLREMLQILPLVGLQGVRGHSCRGCACGISGDCVDDEAEWPSGYSRCAGPARRV